MSPVTEAITEAVAKSGGRALGGAAVFIPLLQRCGTETTLQVCSRSPFATPGSLTRAFGFWCKALIAPCCLACIHPRMLAGWLRSCLVRLL